LGISREKLYRILNGRSGISPEIAVRLSIAFDTTAESWMNQQIQYDLWQAEQHREELNVTLLTGKSQGGILINFSLTHCRLFYTLQKHPITSPEYLRQTLCHSFADWAHS